MCLSAETGFVAITGLESNAVSGAAQDTEGVAWSLGAGGEDTVAHEMGHLLGLKHVDTGGSFDNPPFEGYPKYGSYGPASIGQHGVDTETGAIFAPSEFNDFMSYSTANWVSPHTYSRLMPSFSGVSEGVMQVKSAPEYVEVLFLSLTIQRNRSVLRNPSFHFPASNRIFCGTGRPQAVQAKLSKIVIHRFPVRKVMRQLAPTAAGFQYIKDAIEYLPVGNLARSAAFTRLFQQWRNSRICGMYAEVSFRSVG